MAVKKEIQGKIAELQILFTPILNKPVTLTFDSHTFTNVIVTSIEHKPVTTFKLAPAKRISLDGKQYTPNLIRVVFKGGEEIVFTDEDTVWTAISGGVRARVGTLAYTFKDD